MNKKISLLILMSYLGTSVVPTSVFASELDNTENIVLVATNEVSTNTYDGEGISEVNKKLSNVKISYVDVDGKALSTEETNETMFAMSSHDYPNGIEMVSVPKSIPDKYVSMVRVNGEEYTLTTQVNYGLKEGLDDLTIEWVYEDSPVMIDRTFAQAMYHESYFFDVELVTGGNGILNALSFGSPRNFTLTKELVKELQANVDKDRDYAALISKLWSTELQLEDEWLSKILNEESFIEAHQFAISGSEKHIDLNTTQTLFYNESKPKHDKIYAYTVDYDNKKLVLAGELNYIDSIKESDNGLYCHSFTGNVKNALNSMVIYMSEELDLDRFHSSNSVEDQEKDFLDGKFHYTVSDIKNRILPDTSHEGYLNFLYGNGIETPILRVNFDNIKSIIAKLNDSDKIGLNVRYDYVMDNYYTGAAYKFHAANKDFIIGESPTYTGTIEPINEKFEFPNIYFMYVLDDSVKVGDTLKLHVVSTFDEPYNSDGIPAVVTERKYDGVTYKEVAFEFTEDVTAKTLFVVKEGSKVEDSKPNDAVGDGLQLRNDKDNYRVNYKYLTEEVGSEGLTFYKGQDFTPGFTLSQANVQSILSKADESYVMSVDINGESFDESPSILKGLSKKFYDLYKNQVYRWVHYKSNLGDKPFEHDNLVAFPLDLKDFKEGDTVYLYTTSNLKGGKVELVKEQKLREELNAGAAYGLVVFDTKIDISDRTFFLTTSKVEVSENGQLPDTGGMAVFTLIGGAIAVIAGGSLLLFGKKKK